METAEKTCLSCSKPLRGRSDKKFCDDYCRSSYNNRHHIEESAEVKAINTALKKNRRILADLLGTEELTRCSKAKLLEKGFQFKYLTHHIMKKKGNTYNFCYEYGYLPLEMEQVLVVKQMERKSVAEVKSE